MKDKRRSFGQQSETLASKLLLEKGYRLLTKNYRCPFGEIDLIVCQGNELVFVEVRSTSGSSFAHPRETIHRGKRQKILKTAKHYMMTNQISEEQFDIRFDAITMIRQSHSKPEIEHHKNIECE